MWRYEETFKEGNKVKYTICTRCGHRLTQPPDSDISWILCKCKSETTCKIPYIKNTEMIERDKRNFEDGYIHGIVDVLNAAERKGFTDDGCKVLFLNDLTEIKNELFLNLNK